MPETTVRDAALDLLRELGMTTVFSNPGSTEIDLLAGLPDDVRFMLGLHEGSVVGMATGHALGTGRPALAVLHTTAGLGNAVGAIATARVNRAPVVVIVGQQDSRHLVNEPFLVGRLNGLAGEYPVWCGQPGSAADVPSLLLRATNEAMLHRGPAVLVVPTDYWSAPWPDGRELASPRRLTVATGVRAAEVEDYVDVLGAAASPVIVVGADADSAATWDAVGRLAEALGCAVWQEPFGARAGFRQDDPRFAGHLPAHRRQLRATLDPHDVVVVVGAPSLRQYLFDEGPLFSPGTRVLSLVVDPTEATVSTAEQLVLGSLAPACTALADRVRAVRAAPTPPGRPPQRRPRPPGPTRFDADGVLRELARRLPEDAVVVEECPSDRHRLLEALPARRPGGFFSAAMGGLGFAMPAAAGLRLAQPDRPVVAVVGDGSSMYAIQSLWSAQHYGIGVLYVVLANGGYAIMDQLAAPHGRAPWPRHLGLDISSMARGLGCRAERVSTTAELAASMDDLIPGLRAAEAPVLIEAVLDDGAQEGAKTE